MSDKKPDDSVQSGTSIPPIPHGGVFPWLAEWTGPSQLVGGVTAFLNMSVIVRLQMPDGTSVSMPVAKPIITNSNSTLVLPIDLTSFTPATGNGSAQQFKYVSDGGDFINCVTFDGTTAGTVAIKIAKPYKLRTTILTETIAGVVHNYSYASPGGVLTRTDVTAAVTETQTVNPQFLTTDIIYAVGFTTNAPITLAAVTLLMIDDGRAWAR